MQPSPHLAQGEKPAANAAMVQALAENIETEMWHMFEKQTSSAYKAKFRTLLFNLKDERNQVRLTAGLQVTRRLAECISAGFSVGLLLIDGDNAGAARECAIRGDGASRVV